MLINIGLCVGVIFGMPADTPVEFKNDARYAFGSFQNSSLWPDGFAFILSFLAPLWVVGGFDSSVHVSEEARNASTAIPWAIILSTAISCILGWAINVSIAFNMGEDIDGILSNPIGQPLATIFFNSFNQRGTLALWSIIIIAQFMAGTSFLVSSSRQVFAFSRDPGMRIALLKYSLLCPRILFRTSSLCLGFCLRFHTAWIDTTGRECCEWSCICSGCGWTVYLLFYSYHGEVAWGQRI
ncbi:amino acid permease-domain-containing protein [Lentinula raphanica]|nr:amino acid permease-domain-containing protein [Lentinula raphanica]